MTAAHPTRVSYIHRCPICNKPDWCMIGERYVMCMRVSSPKVKQLSDGSIAYLHPLNGAIPAPPPQKKREEHMPDLVALMRRLREKTNGYDMECEAHVLGLSSLSLEELRTTVFDRVTGTLAFPMYDGKGGLIGIRLRNRKGQKWAISGSHQGLFCPSVPRPDPLLICEGPTDTAAAVMLGYYAIGRPSCSGGLNHILDFINQKTVRRAVIISDLDDPGMRGAGTLQEHLKIPSVIVLCPAKDLRQFVINGGTKTVLDSIIKQLVWNR